MANELYELKSNPAYETMIRSWKNEDPVNAEEIMNPVVETILNNTHAVKLSLDQHKNDSSKHITIAEKEKLQKIDESANKYIHPNSGVTAGTYRSVTVNAGGHVTSGSNPTTVSGYGLTDVYTRIEVDTKVNTKANNSSLTDHTGNNTVHITSAERTNLNDANSKKHEHSNKAALDSISQAKISTWDGYEQKITNLNTLLNKTIEDTGWIKFTLASGVTAGSLTAEYPMYRRIGNHVYIRGNVIWTAATGNALGFDVVTPMPAAIVPKYHRYEINAMSGSYYARLLVSSSGRIAIENNGRGNISTSWWFNITTDYLLD